MAAAIPPTDALMAFYKAQLDKKDAEMAECLERCVCQ